MSTRDSCDLQIFSCLDRKVHSLTQAPQLAGDLTALTSINMSIEGVYELSDGDRPKVSLRIKGEAEGKWRVQAKVGNNMSCMVTEEDGVFTAGPVMSTKMMPPPELQELESEMSALLTGLTKISRDGENRYIW